MSREGEDSTAWHIMAWHTRRKIGKGVFFLFGFGWTAQDYTH